MKILMLTHRFPYPPIRGDCIRAWGELEYLTHRHDVWLACVDRTRPAARHLALVGERCRGVACVVRRKTASLLRGGWSLLIGRSVTEGYFYDRRLVRIVRGWDRDVRFDAVLTFSPAMAVYAAAVPAPRRVLDMNDVESGKWQSYARHTRPPWSWLYDLEAQRLPRAERAWICAHDVTLMVNERERSKLPPGLRERSAVVRTGVHLARYACQAHNNGEIPVPREPVVGFVGSMSYAPNVRAVDWFGRAVWPLVQTAVPGARWLIVGREPVRSVRRWSRQPGVTVTGFVEDVCPALRALRVFVCPVRDSIGVQTKLIEALAAGRPAVVTPEVAAGLDYDDPPPFLVAGEAAEFAQAVTRLLCDESQARALATRARAVAEDKYGAADQLARVERFLQGERTGSARTLARAALAGAHVPALAPRPVGEVTRA
jgi:sugar transferase (PEP-CTERM/EpsH1 system associated)